MKTVKANNFDQAKKELNDLDNSLIGKLKDTIKAIERKFYHVITVRITDQPGQANNKVSVNTIIVNDDKFIKLKRNSAFLGFSKLILLHDPTQDKEEEETVLHVHDKEAIREEARKELQKEYDDKLNEKIAEMESKKTQEASNKGGDASELENDYVEAMSGKKDDLVAFMVKYEIDQSDIVNNEDRQKAITAYFEGQNE
tara:strand:- start:23178 stop:23774 length:597 start_codon:yes stop_codon:yes gene_type:complete